ncbi:SRPBCC family protein [Paraferrimonas sedimenticola]|uniref:Ubiquinone-binding protein n=1 Tax=Paraferrimonas sedimenticola TaxID=375674 RepID=A0AA37VSY8_9GAMM|nr:SRPBCC family protein [Paraferrimonas sedimenticola]GLP95019.1 ubiquinone-binding protein [Paraferrimonas sedimenticola]
MPQISRSALVRFSAEQMYALVNDVDNYPKFLPGCVGSEVLSQSDAQMTARVDVAKSGINQSFTTLNSLESGRVINMALQDGPFKTLEGQWRFLPLTEDACKVELELEFEFSNKIVEMAFGKVFKELMGAMVNAFTERAKVVYSGN